MAPFSDSEIIIAGGNDGYNDHSDGILWNVRDNSIEILPLIPSEFEFDTLGNQCAGAQD